MVILCFVFLFLVFYPSVENFENVFYLKGKKVKNTAKLLFSTENSNVDNKENNVDNNVDTSIESTDYIWPLDYGVGQISSVLGYRGGIIHKGWDISTVGKSQPIYSIGDGIVIRTGISGSLTSGFGYICCVQYSNNKIGEFMIIYPHMKETTKLKVGEKVKKGDLIGYTGMTGSSTGVHLHYQMGPVKDYNKYYNPLRLLHGMEMKRSNIESWFGLTFQSDSMNSKKDQKLNIENNIDTLLWDGWLN